MSAMSSEGPVMRKYKVTAKLITRSFFATLDCSLSESLPRFVLSVVPYLL